jgi:hypothetical protein
MTATYEKIATTTLGSDSSSITFSAISTAYTDLVLVSNFGVTASGNNIDLRVGNGSIDTGSNYSVTTMYQGGASGGTIYSDRSSNANTIRVAPNMGYNTTVNSNTYIASFNNYSNTTTNKTVLIRAGNPAGGSGGYPGTGAFVGLWRSTSAINYVSLIGNSNSFKTGSTFTLYGIKAE